MPIIPLDTNFDGFYSDNSRDQIPKGHAYRLIDYIPQNGAPARGRGGWSYASSKLGGSWISGGGWFRKSLDALTEYVLVVNDSGKIYKLPPNLSATGDAELVGTITERGHVGEPDRPLSHQSFWWKDKLFFMRPAPRGGTALWTGKKIEYGIGSYTVGAPWGDFLVVGNRKGNTHEIGWCISADALLDPDATAKMPSEIVAIAGFPDQIIVFGYQETWTLLGTTPPPGGDMRLHTLYSGNGCMDQRSMQVSSSFVIWANSTGIYRADGGSEPVDLTTLGGISLYWRALVREFDLQAGWIASSGLLNNYYFISVHDADGNLLQTLVCDLVKGKWFQTTNIDASCFIHRPGGINSTEELFFGQRNSPRIGALSGLWYPGAENNKDGDGYEIKPVIETRYYWLSQSDDLKRVRHFYADYQLDSTDGYVEFTVGFADTPEATEYQQLGGSFPLSAKATVDRVDVRARLRGISFRIEQSGPSDDTKLFGLKLEGHALSEMR